MKSAGLTLALLGAGSFLLGMLEREFLLLGWIDAWGVDIGNAIRVAMIVVGAGLWFRGNRSRG